MPRFSLKDLLIGMALLAAGITAICGIWRLPTEPTQISLKQFMSAAMLLWFGGGAFVGAALFTPFKKAWLGAVLGFLVQGALFLAMNNL